MNHAMQPLKNWRLRIRGSVMRVGFRRLSVPLNLRWIIITQLVNSGGFYVEIATRPSGCLRTLPVGRWL